MMKAPKKRLSPKAGQRFHRIYKGKEYTLTVIDIDGELRYEVLGTLYKSPTAAATAVTKTSANGWLFWKLA